MNLGPLMCLELSLKLVNISWFGGEFSTAFTFHNVEGGFKWVLEPPILVKRLEHQHPLEQSLDIINCQMRAKIVYQTMRL